ncbi:MAG: ammonium transporter [Chloroflexi bacterium]|nr:ammonium transporter [Chloroflexota bacterium]
MLEVGEAGNNAWLLTSAALVLLMTPGLAFFYSGLVRTKSAAATIMQSFAMAGVATIVWVMWGYSLAFGTDIGGFVGNLTNFGLRGLEPTADGLAFMVFQMMFAIITPALITGAFVERISFKALLVFTVLWISFVYAPICHWVWYTSDAGDGWLYGLGALDFAGGTVVHINAGAAALAGALFVGRRRDSVAETRPHDVSKVVIGAGLLWFGWFGFNAGSALAADGAAINAFVQTQISAAGGLVAWTLLTWKYTGHPSIIGAATGAVAGLVAITPAAGSVGQWPATDGYLNFFPALCIGAVASILGFYAIRAMHRWRDMDDTLDVFAVHGVGGIWGALAIGIFAVSEVTGGANGFIGGSADLIWRQFVGVIAALAWSLALSSILFIVVQKLMPLRVNETEEMIGLDRSTHNEPAYEFDEIGFGWDASEAIDEPIPSGAEALKRLVS